MQEMSQALDLIERMRKYDPNKPKFVVESEKIKREITWCPTVEIPISTTYCSKNCVVNCEFRKMT